MYQIALYCIKSNEIVPELYQSLCIYMPIRLIIWQEMLTPAFLHISSDCFSVCPKWKAEFIYFCLFLCCRSESAGKGEVRLFTSFMLISTCRSIMLVTPQCQSFYSVVPFFETC